MHIHILLYVFVYMHAYILHLSWQRHTLVKTRMRFIPRLNLAKVANGLGFCVSVAPTTARRTRRIYNIVTRFTHKCCVFSNPFVFSVLSTHISHFISMHIHIRQNPFPRCDNIFCEFLTDSPLVNSRSLLSASLEVSLSQQKHNTHKSKRNIDFTIYIIIFVDKDKLKPSILFK